MDVRPLVVHVLDPVRGMVVLHPGPRQLAAAPLRLPTGVRLARRRLAQHPAIEFGRDAVVVETGGMLGRLPDRHPIGRQLGKARPEARVDIALQDLGGGEDMGIGIVDAEPVFHAPSSLLRAGSG